MSLSRLTAFLMIAPFLPGCVKVVQHRIANYSPGAPATTAPVPETAVYSVKVLNDKGKKIYSIDGSQNFLKQGTQVGFATNDTGTVYALAGDDSFPIDVPPGHFIVWSSYYRRPTQFSKEVAKAALATGKAAAVGSGLFVRSLLKLDDNEDDEPCYPVSRPVPR